MHQMHELLEMAPFVSIDRSRNCNLNHLEKHVKLFPKQAP